jgi:hypothetical protein
MEIPFCTMKLVQTATFYINFFNLPREMKQQTTSATARHVQARTKTIAHLQERSNFASPFRGQYIIIV